MLYTGLTFIEELPYKDSLSAIKKQKEILLKELEFLKSGQKLKSKYYKISPFVKLVFDNMNSQVQLQIQFVEKLEKLINELQ